MFLILLLPCTLQAQANSQKYRTIMTHNGGLPDHDEDSVLEN